MDVSLTNEFADKTIRCQDTLLITRQINTPVDADVILSCCQQMVFSAKCLVSESSYQQNNLSAKYLVIKLVVSELIC